MENEAQKLVELMQKGLSIWVEKDGKTIFQSHESMLKPLYDCLNEYPNEMKGAIVIDKIVGLAAAYLCILGKVNKVITPVASETAKDILEQYKITLYASEIIPYIINRDKTGMCPMEKMALKSASPRDFYNQLSSMLTH